MSEYPLDSLAADDAASPKVPYDSMRESGCLAMAACNTEISAYNSSIAPWHGHALGEDDGIEATGAGTEIQFPFPSLK